MDRRTCALTHTKVAGGQMQLGYLLSCRMGRIKTLVDEGMVLDGLRYAVVTIRIFAILSSRHLAIFDGYVFTRLLICP